MWLSFKSDTSDEIMDDFWETAKSTIPIVSIFDWRNINKAANNIQQILDMVFEGAAIGALFMCFFWYICIIYIVCIFAFHFYLYF